MKKINLFLILIIFGLTVNSFSVTRIISVQNFTFSPTPINAFVGDTIKWQWVSGIHTTTSTTIPVGAGTWDSPLSSASPTFTYVLVIPGTYNYKCTPHELMGMVGVINTQPSSIRQIETFAGKYELKQNYPNPFNPLTKIDFNVSARSEVKISIYDGTGRLISQLVNETLNEGAYSVDFDGSEFASGIYYYKMETPSYNNIKKMVLIK